MVDALLKSKSFVVEPAKPRCIYPDLLQISPRSLSQHVPPEVAETRVGVTF
jgi:hypothetical protein